jgi:hypothetical protein
VRALNAALYPPVPERQSPGPASGCPPFRGKDTVLHRPDGQMPDSSTVRPGAYTMRDPGTGETYRVVWWDPLLLDAPAEDARGLRRDDLIARDARKEDVAADRARYDAWRAHRAGVQERGAHASLRIVTATEWAKGEPAAASFDPATIGIESIALHEVRPSGRRFGILVHALLAAVPIDATPEQIAELALLHARVLAASDEERAMAATLADRVLRHRVFDEARAAAAAGRACRREAPIAIVVGETLIDGQVDLAFDTGSGWIVVDFKTDAELGASEDGYRRQVALYAHALRSITGQPAQGLILKI